MVIFEMDFGEIIPLAEAVKYFRRGSFFGDEAVLEYRSC